MSISIRALGNFEYRRKHSKFHQGLDYIVYLYIVLPWFWLHYIALMGRAFANGPGDLGSIPGAVSLLKWYLIPHCSTFSHIRYVSRVKWSNPGKGGAPSPTPRCCRYWKGSLLVAFDYGRHPPYNSIENINMCFSVFSLCDWMLKKHFSWLVLPKVSDCLLHSIYDEKIPFLELKVRGRLFDEIAHFLS